MRAAALLCLIASAGACGLLRGPESATPAHLFASATDELRRGQYASALALADRGIRSAGPDAVQAHRFTFLKIEALLAIRDIPMASALLREPLPAAAELAELRARRRYLEGLQHRAKGEHELALAALSEASAMADRAGAADLMVDAEVLKGQSLARMDRHDESVATLTAALRTAGRLDDRYHLAMALQNLGMVQLTRNRFDEALSWFERVLALDDLDTYMVYDTALANAALCYSQLGDFARALDVLRHVVSVNEQRGPLIYFEQALGELGNTYLLSGQVAEGLPYLRRALDVARGRGESADAALWAASLASGHMHLEQWDQAETFNAEARRLQVDDRYRPYLTLNDAHIAEARGRLADARRHYLEARDSASDDPVVQWQAHAGAARLEQAAGRTDAAFHHFDMALQIVEQTRADMARTEHRLSVQNRLLGLYSQYVDVLIDEGEIERALAVADSSRARVLAERHGVGAQGRVAPDSFSRTAARLDSILLFYWLGATRSYAWIVTADGIGLAPLPADASEIEGLVAAYQRMLVESLGDPLAAASPGDRLYDLLIAPLGATLPSGSRVVVVPDGALNSLNFETLPAGGDRRRYWIEDVEIAVAPSLAMLAAAAPSAARPTGQRSVLLIGDPVESDPEYPPLRYAATEMAAIEHAFAGLAAVYSGHDASPASYAASGPEQFGIVHFAAHAAANVESPLDSAVVLSTDGSGYKLYARDVAERPISADLVTISACRSAGDRTYAGEGLVGFAWAFLRAGAQRVIAGLWDVDDRSTAELMAALYQRLAAGDPPAASLRAAKLTMIASGGITAKPYYWGPFQVFVGSGAAP